MHDKEVHPSSVFNTRTRSTRSCADALKAEYFADPSNRPTTIYDLRVVGETSDGAVERGSVIEVWQGKLGKD